MKMFKKRQKKHLKDSLNEVNEMERTLTVYENMVKTFQEVEDIQADLSEKRSKVELSINDIHHAIELNYNEVEDKINLYHLLEDLLKERRKIKIEQDVLNHMKQVVRTTKKEMKNTKKQIDFTNKKILTYTPRVLTELFEEK